jgi:coenzyme F420-reducing hydrogenase beta subunit
LLATIEKCTGCMACLNSCPIGCISSYMDKEGFYQPVIDEERCLGCGQCEKSCPILQGTHKSFNKEPDVYAAWNKDEMVLKKSSSGGVFGVFAKYILSKQGVVFGAAYNEELEVHHIFIETLEDLKRLQGSKYVQSNIGDSYKLVKKLIIGNNYVLFSGTPCQIAGLYSFLGGDEFENLFTCDLICHGVPSAGVFKRYIRYMEKKKAAKVIDIQMRTKESGWMQGSAMNLKFENNERLSVFPSSNDSYMNGFLFSLFLRQSCYNCQYAKTPRESDITLGDFWGIGNDIPFHFPTKQGVSLVLVNSKKGSMLFDECKVNMFYEKRTLKEAKKGNIMLSPKQYENKYRKIFFNDYQTMSYEKLISIYLRRKQNCLYVLKNWIVKISGRKNIKNIKRLLEK